MFSLRKFVKDGFLSAVRDGSMPDYQIMLYSAGWYGKGVLTEDDIVEIQTELDTQTRKRDDNE